MEERNEKKKLGKQRLINSFKYSWAGLKYAYTYEQSMIIHVTISFLVFVLGIVLKISAIEWCLIFLCVGLVSSMELMNTAVEATVDLVTMKTHPLAKLSKDTASAAVSVSAIMVALVGLIIFVPKIYALIF